MTKTSEHEQLAAIAAAEDWQIPDLMKSPLMRKTNTTVQLAAFNKRPVALRWTRNPTTETQYQAFLRIPGTAANWITRVDPQIWEDEEVKTSVMRELLTNMTLSPVHRSSMLQYLKRLRQVNCPWPELEVIERSVASDKARKAERRR